jgi:4-phytase/acid phosphatase
MFPIGHLVFFFIFLLAPLAPARSARQVPASSSERLRFVVYVSRHGVRSPTGKAQQYNVYSANPWPEWQVPPGYLTPHGYELMRLFGVYDRAQLAAAGLVEGPGCTDANHVSFIADSDQRTRETARALAEGIFPGCSIAVTAKPEGAPDPLFHPTEVGAFPIDSEGAVAAVRSRMGGDPANLAKAYHARIAELDSVLAGCGTAPAAPAERQSLFSIPAILAAGKGDHAAELRGPLSTAGTLSENLLLEYAEGMPAAQVGWGCVRGDNLQTLVDLHTASFDFMQRAEPIARMQASNLLDHVRRSLAQAASGHAVAGSPGRPGDRVLFLIGHDTNLANLAALLHLTWIADGRRDDTPPGSALVFELWESPQRQMSVRVYFTSQTLEQMREARTLSPTDPPVRAPLYLPGCSRKDLSCAWTDFDRAVSRSIDARFEISD